MPTIGLINPSLEDSKVRKMNITTKYTTNTTTSIEYIDYINSFNASIIILLNIFKFICIKKLCDGKSLIPYTLFMLNSFLADMLVGLMLLLVTGTDFVLALHPDANHTVHEVNRIAKCGLFSSYCVSFIHLNAYEVFRVLVVLRPFLRQTITIKMVFRVILATWITTIVLGITFHVCMKISTAEGMATDDLAMVGMTKEDMMEKYENFLLSILAIITISMLLCCHRIIKKVLETREGKAQEMMEAVSCRKSSSDEQRRRRTGIIAVLIFSICWLPYIASSVTRLFGFLEDSEKIMKVQAVVNIIPHLNCMWNSALGISFLVLEIEKCKNMEMERKGRSVTILSSNSNSDRVSTEV